MAVVSGLERGLEGRWNRLALADDEIAVPPKRPGDRLEHRALVLGVDVDKQVPAGHEVEPGFRRTADEVVAFEGDGSLDRLANAIRVGVGIVIDVLLVVRQEPEFTAEVGRSGVLVDALTGDFERVLADIGRQDFDGGLVDLGSSWTSIERE